MIEWRQIEIPMAIPKDVIPCPITTPSLRHPVSTPTAIPFPILDATSVVVLDGPQRTNKKKHVAFH